MEENIEKEDWNIKSGDYKPGFNYDNYHEVYKERETKKKKNIYILFVLVILVLSSYLFFIVR